MACGLLLGLGLWCAAASPAAAQGRSESWDWVAGARGGVYLPMASLIGNPVRIGSVESELAVSPFVAVEVGLARGRPAFIARLLVGHAPSIDHTVGRAACGPTGVCEIGVVGGSITTVVAEIATPISPFGDWDISLVGGGGGKRYSFDELERPCADTGASESECRDAALVLTSRSVFTVHGGIESARAFGRYEVFVEVTDFLSGFGVSSGGESRFQNDIVVGAGLRVRR